MIPALAAAIIAIIAVVMINSINVAPLLSGCIYPTYEYDHVYGADWVPSKKRNIIVTV